MGVALERHTGGRDLPVVRERARELAAASVSANTRRSRPTVPELAGALAGSGKVPSGGLSRVSGVCCGVGI